MAGIQYFGQVGSTGVSTGPHKHVYVKELATGKYLDPATIRTPLLGLRIGEKKIPALIKTADGKIDFNPAAGITLTSRYGPRNAPTAGASSFHRGEDWALPEGTPIYYEGGGKFIPKANQGGYGNLATLVTGDNKYEIGLGHMKTLGGASELPPTTLPVDTATSTASASSGSGDDLNTLMSLLQLTKPRQKTLQESILEQSLGEALTPKPSIAQQFLLEYMNSPLPGVG
jgi:murein DD-endopeptidase MepM/ murein hydrolase activator NlpD